MYFVFVPKMLCSNLTNQLQNIKYKAQARTGQPEIPWHFLYFLPDPHGQGSLRPTFG
jgi:hypothetical protein